jgi:hypothetical protein
LIRQDHTFPRRDSPFALFARLEIFAPSMEPSLPHCVLRGIIAPPEVQLLRLVGLSLTVKHVQRVPPVKHALNAPQDTRARVHHPLLAILCTIRRLTASQIATTI